MKHLLKPLLAAALACGLLTVTGCRTVSTTNPDGSTTVVKSIDPVKLQQAKDAIEPAASSVLRRAIRRSPEHAEQIAAYARTIGGIFCRMSESNRFSVDFLVDAADRATAELQDAASEDIIDAKNGAIALFKIFAADELSWQLPDNQWLKAISDLFCDSIDMALKDSGQAGL